MGFLSNKIWVRIFLGHPVLKLMEHYQAKKAGKKGSPIRF